MRSFVSRIFPVCGKKNGMDVEDTWRGHFRRALDCVKKHWRFDTSKLTIFVTGGASRMSFVGDDIKEVYGDNIRCFFGNDGERSYSVVKGLAWAGYATDLIDSERKLCDDKISDFLSSGYKGHSMVVKMLSSISSTLADNLVANIKAKMTNNPSEINTKSKIEIYTKEVASDLISKFPIKEKVLSLASEMLSTTEIKNLFVNLQDTLGRTEICAKMPEFKIAGDNVHLPFFF